MSIQRKFILGEEWLYLKIYAGIGFQDKLLAKEILEITSILYRDQLIDKFFFIRYNDQDGSHLRLRFHISDTAHILVIIQLVKEKLKPAIINRSISKISWDTYVRELERYGTDSIEAVESIFSINSWKVITSLSTSSNAQENAWLIAIGLTDELMNSFNLNQDEKHQLMEISYQHYFKRFGEGKELKNTLKDRYREKSSQIREQLNSSQSFDNYHLLSDSLNPSVQSDSTKKIISLHQQKEAGKAELILVIRSLVHMIFNRTFSYSQNTFELVIYYMLSNFYKSEAIRVRNKSAEVLIK
ncbi:thiopeptide-type bacteriocin biosynthesis protein [Pedobacter cryoconitis]|uniref:Thiopeptide-type bacteriocin biosynthesis protein n=1 Tax=Pedobacter cryoconitis TaxID=188932 RepID=A0A7W8YTS9_9SPHI|nr:thiopeptide-type bacteriocin biosynthesis protein [Pedobacter cryoconitis]MBB5621671.1 thiopeptide-type bacteriocin biosynthesis protein [Pedobacter cryoconitis]